MTKTHMGALALLTMILSGCAFGTEAGNPDEKSKDASADGDPQSANAGDPCAAPATAASCSACSGKSCQSNGCYNGYFCNTQTLHCMKSCP